jgi:ABC-type Fe3+-siderophore transport system permease subunit
VIAALIAVQFTQNNEIIVNASLISTWIVLIILTIFRSRFAYNIKLKDLDKNNSEEYEKARKQLLITNGAAAILFSVVLGFVLYNMRNQVLNSLNNDTAINIQENITHSPTLYLRIGIAVILLIIFVIRLIKRKQKTQIIEGGKSN